MANTYLIKPKKRPDCDDFQGACVIANDKEHAKQLLREYSNSFCGFYGIDFPWNDCKIKEINNEKPQVLLVSWP